MSKFDICNVHLTFTYENQNRQGPGSGSERQWDQKKWADKNCIERGRVYGQVEEVE